jgi:hypothetical protein
MNCNYALITCICEKNYLFRVFFLGIIIKTAKSFLKHDYLFLQLTELT